MVSEKVFLFHSLLLGAYITFVYDWLRIFRRVISHNSFFVSAEDLLFWIYCAMEVFWLLYHESNGTLRWFGVLGAAMGIFLYKKSFSEILVKYVSKILCKLLEILRKGVGRIFRIIKREEKALERKAHGKTESCVSQETSESV